MSAAPLPPAAGRLVSADTLAVAPDLLGRTLAEPWRRLAAIIADILIISLLSLLSAPWLGLATGALLLCLLGHNANAPLALKAVRTLCRALGAVLTVLSVLALGHVSLFRDHALQLDAFTGRAPSVAMTNTISVAPEASATELRGAVSRLQEQVEQLKDEHREGQKTSASWVAQARAFANALGVTFGWSGVYFTLCAGALGGRTLGKLLLKTRAVKTNGLPFTFFDAFVRQGGYIAGVAMGLIGFLKLLWEPNRQTVEDRIAGTVVVRER